MMYSLTIGRDKEIKEYLKQRKGLQAVWKEAARVFALSRLVIAVVTLVCIFLLTHVLPGYYQQMATHFPYNTSLLYSWYRWDALAYAHISLQGQKNIADTAFFPLWPLIGHYGGILFGGFYPTSYYLFELLAANICFYFSLVLLYHLLSQDFDPSLARRALYYLAFSSYGLFFFAGYSESLFLLLCIAFFVVLRRGKLLDYWLAGLLGFLAVLTRSPGLALAIPFLVVYIQRFWLAGEGNQQSWLQKLNALVPIVLIPAALLLYMLYLGYTTGNPLIFNVEEAQLWHRHFTFPWNGFISAIKYLFTYPPFLGKNLLDITFTLLPVLALVFSWQHLPWHYRLLAITLILFTLSVAEDWVAPLTAEPRFMLTIFPITIIFAFWGKRPLLHRLLISFFFLFFVLNIIVFIDIYWEV